MAHVEITCRAAGLLVAQECLLLQRKMTDSFWALPGGTVKRGESSAQSMMRELAEEIGWHAPGGDMIGMIDHTFSDAGRDRRQFVFHYRIDASDLHSAIGGDAGVELVLREPDLRFCWWPIAEISRTVIRPAASLPLIEDNLL